MPSYRHFVERWRQWGDELKFRFYLHGGSAFFSPRFPPLLVKNPVGARWVSTVVKLSYCPVGRFTSTDALCFANRTPAEAIRPASRTSAGSYSNYSKVLHRSGVHMHTHTYVFFFIARPGRHKCKPMYSLTFSCSFVQNFTRYQNNQTGKWIAPPFAFSYANVYHTFNFFSSNRNYEQSKESLQFYFY